jgi:hypothetical protein
VEDHFEVLIGMAWPHTRTGKPEERQMAVQKLTHGMLAKLLPGGLGCGGMCRAVLGCAGLCYAALCHGCLPVMFCWSQWEVGMGGWSLQAERVV